MRLICPKLNFKFYYEEKDYWGIYDLGEDCQWGRRRSMEGG